MKLRKNFLSGIPNGHPLLLKSRLSRVHTNSGEATDYVQLFAINKGDQSGTLDIDSPNGTLHIEIPPHSTIQIFPEKPISPYVTEFVIEHGEHLKVRSSSGQIMITGYSNSIS